MSASAVKETKREHQDERLLESFRPGATLAEQLEGILALGISASLLHEAIEVSPESLRLWRQGAPIRQANRVVVENIGRAISTLLKALGASPALDWLTQSQLDTNFTPLQLIRHQPQAILAAADAHAAGRTSEEQVFITQALRESGLLQTDSDPLRPSEATERSSTQLKRLLLGRLLETTAKHVTAREVIHQLDTGFVPELERLPNYQVYESFLGDLRKQLLEAGDAPAEQAISALLTDVSTSEQELLRAFEAHGAALLTEPSTILTYALSMRVIQALWGVPPELQADSRLYVAEGRVKSIPTSGELLAFADAGEILSFLEHTAYERYVVADAAASALIEGGKVDVVMLGAQKVFAEGGEPTHFVATAGTNALLRAARARADDERRIRVLVFAEQAKIVEGVEDPEAKPRESVVSVQIPGSESEGEGYAPLLSVSAELCDIREHGAPPVVELITESAPVPA